MVRFVAQVRQQNFVVPNGINSLAINLQGVSGGNGASGEATNLYLNGNIIASISGGSGGLGAWVNFSINGQCNGRPVGMPGNLTINEARIILLNSISI